jgi:hypothetical protein
MKQLTILIAAFLISLPSIGQNAKVDATGNYVSVTASKKSETAKETGKTFTDAKGIKYPVMESKNGKLYYIRTSKSGSEYKVYLKL